MPRNRKPVPTPAAAAIAAAEQEATEAQTLAAEAKTTAAAAAAALIVEATATDPSATAADIAAAALAAEAMTPPEATPADEATAAAALITNAVNTLPPSPALDTAKEQADAAAAEATAKQEATPQTPPSQPATPAPAPPVALHRTPAGYDYANISAAPAHMLPAEATPKKTKTPDKMTPQEKDAAYTAGIDFLAPIVARNQDDPDFTRRKLDEGFAILAHANFARTAFPGLWGDKMTLDTIVKEITDRAARLTDNGASTPRPKESISGAFLALTTAALGIPRDTLDCVAWDRVKTLARAALNIDETRLTATILPGFADFLRVAIPANLRGASQWTRDNLKKKLDEHRAYLAAQLAARLAEQSNTDGPATVATVALPTQEATAPTTQPEATENAPQTPPSQPEATEATPDTTPAEASAPQPATAEASAPAPATAPTQPAAVLNTDPAKITPEEITATLDALYGAENFPALLIAVKHGKALLARAAADMAAAEEEARAEAQRRADAAAAARAAMLAEATAGAA